MASEKTACILCSRNCGLEVEIENGKFTKIRGDKDHPLTKGYICQKAARLEHYQNHGDRLQFPLKREANGTFTRVSWDEALTDIAQRLLDIRKQHGGDAFAFVGGGGQGNHIGGAYSRQILSAMKSRYAYNALGQEKTGDFWLNGRLFGRQTCHTTEDVEHADYVLFIGTNPFQAHGIPNARDTLKEIKKDPNRTMVVIDPRRSETAKQADIHLQVKPGTDAYLMSAMLSIIVRENLHDRDFLTKHCTGFDQVEQELLAIPIEEYAQRADVPLADIERVARGFATAKTACVRIDLGIQQTLHTTLNGYLEKLLYLITGNFGKRGGNNLHTFFLPLLGHTDERKKKNGKSLKLTAHHKMYPIAGIYPPNILPDEIEHKGENRIRAVFVDSSNPLMTYADTQAYERAFKKLELLVVVDVAMTETAHLAHYVLPAASQFEKWEATGFNLEFPENAFHLRHALFPKLSESLGEPEIYTRLLEKMEILPDRFPLLERIAKHEPKASNHLVYMTAIGATLARNKSLIPFAASILYRTLGKALPNDAAAAAPLLPLAIQYTQTHYKAVRRAGYQGNRLTLGTVLFNAILNNRAGTLLSKHEFKDIWSLIQTSDKRVHLAIPEMFRELRALKSEVMPGADYPFILMAGERRSYNANQIYRDPNWRKVDPHGAMRMHPDDAKHLELEDGSHAICESATGMINVVIEIDDAVRRGMVTLPHGYGMRYQGSAPIGPELNRLTSGTHCDPLSKTPFHKHVPVNIRKVEKIDLEQVL
ncbi:molybdopterin-dependent oxidoreductase [Acinetobacter sp. V91_7]|uniref:molybdopterin-dependent oxidoreductase n=1 Tax=unclassified Acinetobacter TaxID=196816 RepID=UPI00287CC800|nr:MULTISPECIES: molybdopterin-dependent oxidoreductase [unclassified Acinetobacter]MDS7927952.1 molybdopterin-dependent oxidoreductase [Acinetobacter sp. V102_4]MDS7932449.1 molybdopterin-dependent oxidoreductase [Acinetobacter sp. V91_4B]MDS7961408.1 molybdopterin-dependent oxidoreductase [Acinetobacter sp. V91_7]MDS8025930.1 molybdopterin-dependent oxidoreductase [Acinetobacter sp. V91_13]